MTSGPEHYREAEARIEVAFESATWEMAAVQMAAAQVHATLALAASNIEAATRRPSPEWAEVVS